MPPKTNRPLTSPTGKRGSTDILGCSWEHGFYCPRNQHVCSSATTGCQDSLCSPGSFKILLSVYFHSQAVEGVSDTKIEVMCLCPICKRILKSSASHQKYPIFNESKFCFRHCCVRLVS